jgi:nitrate reductase / nitrite oxidoreductase, beta subunit
VVKLSAEEQAQMFAIEKMVMFYLPRICNHCLNAGCVAGCPSGAIYKRGEDGIVLVNQDKCRGWRMCVSACPYKKTYYGWTTGKSEKCILCYPRQEAGEAPACFHSCVGRIRYLGVLLYDADRIEAVAMLEDHELAAAQREIILDPTIRRCIAAARQAGLPEQVLRRPALAGLQVRQGMGHRPAAAPRVPHPADALLRAAAVAGAVEGEPGDPAAGRRLLHHAGAGPSADAISGRAVRRRQRRGGQGGLPQADRRASCSAARQSVGDLAGRRGGKGLRSRRPERRAVDAIYRMTALTRIKERIVVPPMLREQAIEAGMDPEEYKQGMGFGSRRPPKRRW